uniref:Uncharacterized protein n=1 Tax=Oryza nivara TaxID=4536 RepID=A0A0E0IFX4_ORYNI
MAVVLTCSRSLSGLDPPGLASPRQGHLLVASKRQDPAIGASGTRNLNIIQGRDHVSHVKCKHKAFSVNGSTMPEHALDDSHDVDQGKEQRACG